jgi:Domain of unknown function (DUF6456)
VNRQSSERDIGRFLKRLAAGESIADGVDPKVAESLLARGLICREGQALRLTEEGGAWLRRSLGGEDRYANQHRTLAAAIIDDEALGRQTVVVNTDESPLARLRRTKGRGGKPFIDDSEFAAGERLRNDYTRARLTPRVTANWSAAVAAGRRDGGGMADVTDAAIAARQRVNRALGAVGPDFAGVLVDFCCFLKGIEEIEKERCWPARSAKLVIRLALASLARHYGLSRKARGPARAHGVRHWGADDYRPAIDPEDESRRPPRPDRRRP